MAVLIEGGGTGTARVDIRLGSIGESMASGGFKRKLRLLLLEERVFGEGIAGVPCSLFGDDGPKGLSKWRLFIDTDSDIIFASGGAYNAAAERASRPWEWSWAA